MKADGDEVYAAILACAETIRTEDVEAELEAAMGDPLLQDIVAGALGRHKDLTPEQIEHARGTLLAYFATEPRAERLLDEVRSAGGKSHVVATKGSGSADVTKLSIVPGRGTR